MVIAREGQPLEIEKIFPKDVLPTVGFVLKLPGVEIERSSGVNELYGWSGVTVVNGTELLINALFNPKVREIKLGGRRPFEGRESHISITRSPGESQEGIVESWILYEIPKDNQLLVFQDKPIAPTMLLPDEESRESLVLGGKLIVAKGKLDRNDGFLTEKDIDGKKSEINYEHYDRRVAFNLAGEVLKSMRALADAMVTAKPTEG